MRNNNSPLWLCGILYPIVSGLIPTLFTYMGPIESIAISTPLTTTDFVTDEQVSFKCRNNECDFVSSDLMGLPAETNESNLNVVAMIILLTAPLSLWMLIEYSEFYSCY